MGSDVGDLNNDGLPDLFATDMSATSHYREKVMMGNMDDSAWFLDFAEPRQYMRNALFINSGSDRFYEAAFLSGLLAVYLVLSAIKRGKLEYFAYYCFVAGVAAMVYFGMK